MEPAEAQEEAGYAMALANSSYDWYRKAATRSRRYYRVSETALLIVSAAIPQCRGLWVFDRLWVVPVFDYCG
jgi:hypothetical protein